MKSTSLDNLFSRAALAGWIVTLEKLIDPATSLVFTGSLASEYLDPENASFPNAENVTGPVTHSLS
jgi:hypothetical protein